jgi:hypothetical protein
VSGSESDGKRVDPVRLGFAFVIGVALGVGIGYWKWVASQPTTGTETALVRQEPPALTRLGLAKEIDSYTKPEFQALIAPLETANDFKKTDVVSMSGKRNGTGPTCSADIVLESVTGAGKVSHTMVRNHRPTGYVIGRITNTSTDCLTNRYRFAPGHTLYLIVQRMPGSDQRFRTRLYDYTAPAAKSPDYGFEECGAETGSQQGHGDLAEMRYRSTGCSERRDGSPARTASASVPIDSAATKKIGLAPGLLDQLTIWYSCDLTCCFADE